MSKPTKAIAAQEPAQTARPKMKMRHQQTIFHHLFKALLKNFMKNRSWKKGVVDIEMVEHVHHYHSVNSMGMPQRFTNTVGGHFHEVKWTQHPDGTFSAECGPPIRKVSRRMADGTSKTFNEPVKFKDQMNLDGDGNPRTITDNHIHEMEYQGSDQLTPEFIRSIQQQNANATMPQAQANAEKGSIENDEVKMEVL